ncbi:MAG: hypothetical protein KTR31_20135 [Myxococcales bacterium]|nr:hypothetical protein [Myxococcales bacterium]
MRTYPTGNPWRALVWLTLAGCGNGLTPLNRGVDPVEDDLDNVGSTTSSTSTYPYTSTPTYDSVDTGTPPPVDTGFGTGKLGGNVEGTWIAKGASFGTVVLEFGPTSKDCYINFLGSGYTWAPCAYATKGADLFFADSICPSTGTYAYTAQTKATMTMSLISDPKCKGRDVVLANTWDYIGPWGSFSYY